jgi:predicted transglutaminase-like cysteine proteinase
MQPFSFVNLAAAVRIAGVGLAVFAAQGIASAAPLFEGIVAHGTVPADPGSQAHDDASPPVRLAALSTSWSGQDGGSASASEGVAPSTWSEVGISQPALGDGPQRVPAFVASHPILARLNPTLLPGAGSEGHPAISAPKNVFGSVNIKISHSVHDARWTELLAENADRLFAGNCGPDTRLCNSPAFRRLAAALESARSKPIEDGIRLLNLAVNRTIRFVDDEILYGRADYWATFRETVLAGRGDCEDFALVKMWMLRAAGIPPEAIHLVLSKETRRQVDHALVVVRVGEVNLVLDSLSDEVLSDRRLAQYQPLVSLSSQGAWMHGIRTSGL